MNKGDTVRNPKERRVMPRHLKPLTIQLYRCNPFARSRKPDSASTRATECVYDLIPRRYSRRMQRHLLNHQGVERLSIKLHTPLLFAQPITIFLQEGAEGAGGVVFR